MATTVPEPLRIRATGPIFFVFFVRISQVFVPAKILLIQRVLMGIAESVVILVCPLEVFRRLGRRGVFLLGYYSIDVEEADHLLRDAAGLVLVHRSPPPAC